MFPCPLQIQRKDNGCWLCKSYRWGLVDQRDLDCGIEQALRDGSHSHLGVGVNEHEVFGAAQPEEPRYLADEISKLEPTF